jgi:hypothetical protein
MPRRGRQHAWRRGRRGGTQAGATEFSKRGRAEQAERSLHFVLKALKHPDNRGSAPAARAKH